MKSSDFVRPALFSALVSLWCAAAAASGGLAAEPSPSPSASGLPSTSGWVKVEGAEGAVGAIGVAAPVLSGSGSVAVPGQMQAAMRRDMAEMEGMREAHLAFRARMLAALTAAHRALFAQIVGGLAIAPQPDPYAAAQELKALLSPDEAQAVVREEEAEEAALQKRFEQMAAAADATMQESSSAAPLRAPMLSAQVSTPDDAGSILLRMAGTGLMVPPRIRVGTESTR